MRALCFFALAAFAFAQAQQPAPSKPSSSKPAAQVKQAPRPGAGVKPGAAVPAPESTPATTSTSDSKPIITIGNEKISTAEYEQFVDILPDQIKAQARGPMKRQIAQEFVKIKVLAAEARKRGLDKDPTNLARLKFQMENALANLTFTDMLKKTSVDDAGLRKSYEESKGQYEQAQARHILIRYQGSPAPARPGQKDLSEQEALAKAQDIHKRLMAGEDFATVAKAESDDTGSGANGGDLGMFGRGAMVGPFDQAAFSLPIGQLSEPIKSQFGYHLIKVEKRDSKSFEQVKPELEERARPNAAREAADQLVAGAKVELDESYFGPAALKPSPDANAPAATPTPGATPPPPAPKPAPETPKP